MSTDAEKDAARKQFQQLLDASKKMGKKTMSEFTHNNQQRQRKKVDFVKTKQNKDNANQENLQSKKQAQQVIQQQYPQIHDDDEIDDDDDDKNQQQNQTQSSIPVPIEFFAPPWTRGCERNQDIDLQLITIDVIDDLPLQLMPNEIVDKPSFLLPENRQQPKKKAPQLPSFSKDEAEACKRVPAFAKQVREYKKHMKKCGNPKIPIMSLRANDTNGCPVIIRVHGFRPHYLVKVPNQLSHSLLKRCFSAEYDENEVDFRGRLLFDRKQKLQLQYDDVLMNDSLCQEYCQSFQHQLEQSLQSVDSMQRVSGDFRYKMVVSVELILRENSYGYHHNRMDMFFRLTLLHPSVQRESIKILTTRGIVFGHLKNQREFPYTLKNELELYDVGMSLDQLFRIKTNLSGQCYITLPRNKYTLMTDHLEAVKDWHQRNRKPLDQTNINPDGKSTWMQAEFDIDYKDLVSRYGSHEPKYQINTPMRLNMYDIECETNGKGLPNAELNKCLMISDVCNFESGYEIDSKTGNLVYTTLKNQRVNYIFTFRIAKNPKIPDHFKNDPNVLNVNGCKVLMYKNEKDMLMGFQAVLTALQMDLFAGFNNCWFDMPYLLKRGQVCGLENFCLLSPFKRPVELKKSYYKTAAYGAESRTDILHPGTITYDLLRWAKIELKLRSYKLNSVAKHCFGGEKDDLHHSKITPFFYGTKSEREKVAHYNLIDSALCLDLLEKKQIIVRQTELAKAAGVTILDLQIHGQGIRCQSLYNRHYLIPENFTMPNRPKKNVMQLLANRKDERLKQQEQKHKEMLDKYGSIGAYDSEDDENEDENNNNEGDDDLNHVIQDASVIQDIYNDPTIDWDNVDEFSLDKYMEQEDEKYGGALVKDPQVGLQKRKRNGVEKPVPIVTKDFASLYPTNIVANNIDYSTIVLNPQFDMKYLKEEDVVRIQLEVGTEREHETIFVKKHIREGGMPKILVSLLKQREAIKEESTELKKTIDKKGKTVSEEQLNEWENILEILDARSLSLKLLMNSSYGFFGGYVTNCIPAAEAVTYYGRYWLNICVDVAESQFKKGTIYSPEEFNKAFDACVPLKYQTIELRNYALSILSKIEQDIDTVVVYGDTDSLMVDFGVYTLEEANVLAIILQYRCNLLLPWPMNLAFENIKFPFLLFGKKNYVGIEHNPWNFDESAGKYKQKGGSAIKRDAIKYIQVVHKDIVERLIKNEPWEDVMFSLRDQNQKMMNGQFPLSYFVKTTSYKKHYATRNQATTLAKQLADSDEHEAPEIGERLYSVIVKVDDPKAKMSDRVMHPMMALKQNKEPDYSKTAESFVIDTQAKLFRWFVPIHPMYKNDSTLTKSRLITRVKDIGITPIDLNMILRVKTEDRQIYLLKQYLSSHLYLKRLFEPFFSAPTVKIRRQRMADNHPLRKFIREIPVCMFCGSELEQYETKIQTLALSMDPNDDEIGIFTRASKILCPTHIDKFVSLQLDYERKVEIAKGKVEDCKQTCLKCVGPDRDSSDCSNNDCDNLYERFQRANELKLIQKVHQRFEIL